MRCLLVLASVCACGGTFSPARSEPLYVRACNTTDKDFVDVRFRSEDRPGAPLAAGACTPYEQVDFAYDYTYVKFTVGTDEFEIKPIDYIGAKSLRTGRWSYNVKITDYAKR